MTKGRRRREARRRAKQRRQEQQPERPLQDEGEEGELRERPGGDEEPVRSEEAAGGRRGRTARKRAKRKGGFWERVGRLRVSSWMMVVPVLAVVGIVAVLIVTSGSSETAGGGVASTPTPDPRVAGAPVAETIVIVAGDSGPANPTATSFFRPDTITAKAGEVLEIELKNEGSVTHNIWLAGVDEEYGTTDDWGPIDLIPAGETGRLLVGIDEPGTYAFQCEIHQQVQFGTLTLE